MGRLYHGRRARYTGRVTTPPGPLPTPRVIGFAAAAFAQSVLPLVVSAFVLYYYSPPPEEGLLLLSPAVIGTIRMVLGILNAAVEPAVGHLSDRTRTRFGRRRPFMVFGLPLLLLGFGAVWFPERGLPVDAASTQLHLALSLGLFFGAYTLVFAPYNAMLPELTPDDGQRLRVSLWMSLFEVLAQIFGSVVAALLIGVGAVHLGLVSLDNGYQLLALVCIVISVLAVGTALFSFQESPPVDTIQAPGFGASAKTALANLNFRRYGAAVFAFRLASASAVITIPFLGTQLMGLEEAQAPLLLAVIIVVAVLGFPLVQRLAGQRGRAKVFRYGGYGFLIVLPLMGAIGLVPGLPPLVHGVLLFVGAGFSVATLLVLPRTLLADIIDGDAAATGQRKEALYTGMSGVVEKLGEAGASGVVGLLFGVFGNDRTSPMGLRLVGVAAALVLALGLWAFRGQQDR